MMDPLVALVRSNQDEWNNKKVAYLLDVLTARVLDLATGVGIAEISTTARLTGSSSMGGEISSCSATSAASSTCITL